MRRVFLVVLLVSNTLFAAAMGELSLYALKGGKPLQSEALIDDTQKFISDKDGYIFVPLSAGKHSVELYSSENGVMQSYMKKFVFITEGKETQLIVSLKSDGSLSLVDEESSIAHNADEALSEGNVTKKALTYGTLEGVIRSGADGKVVAGAKIFVRGSSVDTSTDKNGKFRLKVASGKIAFSVIHSNFSAQSVSVEVKENEVTTKNIELSPASLEMEEFVVLAPHISGSVAAIVAEQRHSDSVGNVLGSEQFSKSGDSSVAGALKRVSGITIVGGKYVYVRGLGDRYSTVMLNGLHIPSPEPTKRVVPLDIFPTSIVQSLTIQKGFSADIPASFGGGTVLIKSKDIPRAEDGAYASLSAEVSVNAATGKEVTTNSDNAKPLPSVLLPFGNSIGYEVEEQLRGRVANYRSLNREKSRLLPGYKFEVAAGKSYEVNDDFTLGASAMIYVKNESDNNDVKRNKYTYDLTVDAVQRDYKSNSSETTISNENGGMLNVGLDFYEHNRIKYTFFTTTHSSDKTLIADQVFTDVNKTKTYYEYTQTAVTMHQLSGEHDFRFSGSNTDGYFDNLTLKWALESAEATRDEPGSVAYKYYRDEGAKSYVLDKDTFYYYGKLNDNVRNARVDMAFPYKYNGQKNYTQIGMFQYDKTREADTRAYDMSYSNNDSNESIDTIFAQNFDSFYLTAPYKLVDAYQATQSVTSFYAKQLFSVTDDFDLIVSLRRESSSQQLIDSDAKHTPLENSDFFPSLAATYRFDDDDMQLRFAYAKTISRPDFREFSQSSYKDQITENKVFGNPNLKATYIQHLDLKYEWYITADEVFSCALFGKKFTNPIEKVLRSAHGDAGTYYETFINAKSALSYGVEADISKRFGFIDERLSNLLVSSNVALIQSNITIDKNGGADENEKSFISALSTTDRAMQGQSPYVMNFTFGYDNAESGNSALFLFNQIGKRIVSLGTEGNLDIYQEAFAKLDFTLKYTLSEKQERDIFAYALRFKASNLLDSEVLFTQGDKSTTSFRPGRSYSLKFDIKY